MLGVADIVGCTKEGRFFAVEVKAPGKKGTLTSYQEAFLREIENVKGIAVLADCLEDCVKAGL